MQNAEKHILSDFLVYKDGEESKLIPGARVASTAEYKCPACNMIRKAPEHGFVFSCDGCGLKGQAFGNALYLWKEDRRAVEQTGKD